MRHPKRRRKALQRQRRGSRSEVASKNRCVTKRHAGVDLDADSPKKVIRDSCAGGTWHECCGDPCAVCLKLEL